MTDQPHQSEVLEDAPLTPQVIPARRTTLDTKKIIPYAVGGLLLAGLGVTLLQPKSTNQPSSTPTTTTVNQTGVVIKPTESNPKTSVPPVTVTAPAQSAAGSSVTTTPSNLKTIAVTTLPVGSKGATKNAGDKAAGQKPLTIPHAPVTRSTPADTVPDPFVTSSDAVTPAPGHSVIAGSPSSLSAPSLPIQQAQAIRPSSVAASDIVIQPSKATPRATVPAPLPTPVTRVQPPVTASSLQRNQTPVVINPAPVAATVTTVLRPRVPVSSPASVPQITLRSTPASTPVIPPLTRPTMRTTVPAPVSVAASSGVPVPVVSTPVASSPVSPLPQAVVTPSSPLTKWVNENGITYAGVASSDEGTTAVLNTSYGPSFVGAGQFIPDTKIRVLDVTNVAVTLELGREKKTLKLNP